MLSIFIFLTAEIAENAEGNKYISFVVAGGLSGRSLKGEACSQPINCFSQPAQLNLS